MEAARPEIQAVITLEIQKGNVTAPGVWAALKDQFGEHIPSERTIRDMVKEIKDRDPSEPWTLAEAEPDDIFVITPVWAFALEGGLRLSKKHAEWVVRVRKAAPDLPPGDAWALAGLYATAPEIPLAWADALLAFSPWRDVNHAERYCAAANARRIPAPPLVWDLTKRAFLQEDGRHIIPAACPQSVAFFENQPDITIRVKGKGAIE